MRIVSRLEPRACNFTISRVKFSDNSEFIRQYLPLRSPTHRPRRVRCSGTIKRNGNWGN